MGKIDRAIAFVEDNQGMIDSIRCKRDDRDIVAYILKILRRYKTGLEETKNGK